MPKKFVCEISTEELARAYIEEHRTLDEMCEYIGVKSPITVRKILNNRGISTNENQRKKGATMHGMSDEEFRAFLLEKYRNGFSMIKIADELGVTPSAVRKYFVAYNIERRKNTDFLQNSPINNPNWRGGNRKKQSGYIEVYMPNHPNANKRKCVYEHQLVMEQHLGRYLKKGEVVHHIDGNKSNNDITNLVVLSNEDHAKLHAYLRRIQKEGD